MAKRKSSRPREAVAIAITSEFFNAQVTDRLNITPNKLWFGIFGLWMFLLTGITWNITGSPGFLQHYRVSTVFDQKQHDLGEIEAEVASLNTESELLERSVVAQEREVRRTLGYAAPDEMIFDFTASPFSFQKSEALVSANAKAETQKRAKL